MPWKETSPMDQHEQFLADYLRGHFSMQELCLRYAISRKTGYKWPDLRQFAKLKRIALWQLTHILQQVKQQDARVFVLSAGGIRKK